MGYHMHGLRVSAGPNWNALGKLLLVTKRDKFIPVSNFTANVEPALLKRNNTSEQ